MSIFKPFMVSAALFGSSMPLLAQDELHIDQPDRYESAGQYDESYTLADDPSGFTIYDAVKLPTGILVHASISYGYRKEQGWGHDFFLVKTIDGGKNKVAHQLYGNNVIGNLSREFSGENYEHLFPKREYSVYFNSGGDPGPSKLQKAVCWDDIELSQEALSEDEIYALQANIQMGVIPLNIMREGYEEPIILDLNDGRHVVAFYEVSEFYAASRFFIVESDEVKEVQGRSLTYEEFESVPGPMFGGFEIEGVGVLYDYFLGRKADLYKWLPEDGGDAIDITRLRGREAREYFLFETHRAQAREIHDKINPPQPVSICPPTF